RPSPRQRGRGDDLEPDSRTRVRPGRGPAGGAGATPGRIHTPAVTDVAVVGDVMLDVVVESPSLARGGDVHGRVRVHPGGGAANAAVWAAASGSSVRLYGRVGDDVPGRAIREAVAERGVQPVLAADPDEPTGTMLVVLEDGERSMVADRGANAKLAPEDLPPRIEARAVLVS